MTEPAAGWYPDPGGSGKLRYWNGYAWTQHVSPPEPPAEPEAVPEPPPPVVSAPPPTAPLTRAAEAAVFPSAPATSLPPQYPYLPAAAPAPGATAPDRPGPDGQVLSGWWRRLAGLLIDGLIISAVAGIALALYAAVTGGFTDVIDTQAWSDLLAKAEAQPGYQPTEAELQQLLGSGLLPLLGWFSLISLALGFLNGVVLVARSGQTIADRMVGNRKVLAGRRVPGYGPSFLRWLIPAVLSALQVIPVLAVVALLGWILDYLWPLWDPRRQALHDKAAKTYVERSALAGPVNR